MGGHDPTIKQGGPGSLPGSALLCVLFELRLLHLPGSGTRQLMDEVVVERHLVLGDPTDEEVPQVLWRCCVARALDDEGAAHFAPLLVGDPDHCAFGDRGMSEQD